MESLIIAVLIPTVLGLGIQVIKADKDREEKSKIRYEASCEKEREWWKNLQDSNDEF